MLEVGQNILRERLKKGITQAELARRSGISQPNLSAIETGTRDFTIRTLISIAKALETPPSSLLTETVPAAPAKLDRFALDRIARLATGQSLPAKSSEKKIAKDLAFIMQSKIRAFLPVPKIRQSTRALREARENLRALLGEDGIGHLIRRAEKNLVSYA